MSREAAFWDSSALTPLCAQELTTNHCRVLGAQYPQVVWWAARVEIRSAIARLARSGGLDASDERDAKQNLKLLGNEWLEIVPSDELREEAGELLDRHSLRAADSLQLAAALAWCRGKPAQRVFISGDARLCEAAAAEGFTVIRPESEAA